MKLTKRGEFVLALGSALLWIALMGLFGYVETMGYW